MPLLKKSRELKSETSLPIVEDKGYTMFVVKIIFIVLTSPLWILPLLILCALVGYADAKYQMFKEEQEWEEEY